MEIFYAYTFLDIRSMQRKLPKLFEIEIKRLFYIYIKNDNFVFWTSGYFFRERLIWMYVQFDYYQNFAVVNAFIYLTIDDWPARPMLL